MRVHFRDVVFTLHSGFNFQNIQLSHINDKSQIHFFLFIYLANSDVVHTEQTILEYIDSEQAKVF